MKRIYADIDENLFNDANVIFNDVGLSMESAITVMLKRVVRDGGFSFLFDVNSVKAHYLPETKQEENAAEPKKEAQIKMTKNRAIALFKNEGIVFNNNVTFASKNKSSYNYWANPSFDVLDSDWFLILNDWVNREIHLFEIPAKTFRHDCLVSRADKNKIDLQIMHDDSLFTDARSKISFAKYLKITISY